MFRRKDKKENTQLAAGNEKRPNAWKKYGALVMAGVLFASGAAAGSAWQDAGVVQAEEKYEVALNIADDVEEDIKVTEAEEETEKRVGLNIADGAKETADTEAEEKEADVKTEIETEKETEKEEEKATEIETDAAEEAAVIETEAEQKETFAQIESVTADESMIITTDVSGIVESCMPSIVSITNKSVEEVETYYYGVQEFEAESAASGIIVAQNDEELLVATNSHVVENSTELTVCFTVDAENPEDLVVPAKIKGMDKSYELAVVAVQLSDIPDDVRSQLKIATLGSSSKLKVGQAAIAIGNALGYGQSVTSGIISALNREVTIDNFSNEVIMTDAAINFGNSGGALLNAKGQVIGINVAKEAGEGVDSMGYSIPIDTAIPVLQNLVNKETRDRMSSSERGYMGATVVNVSDDAKELYNMPEGAFVYEVSAGSAAEEAGIKKGDVITKFDGESVTSSDDLIEKMSYYGVDETVTVEIMTAHNGEYISHEVEVTLKPGSEEAIASNTTEEEAQEEEQQEEQQQDQNENSDDSYDDFEDYNNQFNGEWNNEWNNDFFFPFGNGDSMF